jgi:hypothetical protein
LDEEHLREKKSQLESKLGISPQKAGQWNQDLLLARNLGQQE